MNNPKFQVFKSPVNQQYYYRLRAANGEIVLNGEGYTTKQNCLNGIAAVKSNAPYDTNYIRNLNFTFNLKATNGEIVGRSETYSSSTACETGISAVKNDAPGAHIEDLTV